MIRVGKIRLRNLALVIGGSGLLTVLFSGCDSGTSPATSSTPPSVLMTKGQAIFATCSGCHGTDAKGNPPVYPPLYQSDFLKANRDRPIKILLVGGPDTLSFQDPIVVNGDTYQGNSMPRGGTVAFTDSDIAAVLTYVRATFDGYTDYIHVEEVAAVRDSLRTECKQIAGCDTTELNPTQ